MSDSISITNLRPVVKIPELDLTIFSPESYVFEAATDLVALRLRALFAVRDEKGRLPPDCAEAIERQLSILHFVTNGEVTARV